MTNMQVCRTCLAQHTRMHTISNTPLLEYYEKITDLPANTQDGRPFVMCYICYHLLKKCRRFTAGAIRANEVLLKVSKDGIEIAKEYVAMIDKRMSLKLCKIPVTQLNLSSGVSESIEIQSRMDFVVKAEKESDDLAEDASTLFDISQDFDMEYEIKTEKLEIGDTEIQTRFSSASDDDVPLKRLCKRDDTAVKVVNNPNEDGRGNKGTLGPTNRKLDQTKQYPESLRVQESSRENAVVEKTLEIETNNWSDNGYTQLYLTCKTDCEKRYDQSNDINVKLFTCNHCGKMFTQMRKMKCHLRLHKGVKPFTCSHCGKKISSKHSFEHHLSKHTGEKPFTCSQCGKKISSKYGLECHLRIHTGEKPFSCSHCGKKFSTKHGMDRHLRIHTGEKPFTCSHCGKKISTKQGLECHLRMHTGERPFKCDLCQKKFTSKSNLKSHNQYIHTGEKPFTCSHCGKKFHSKSNLDRHLKIHRAVSARSIAACASSAKLFATTPIYSVAMDGNNEEDDTGVISLLK